MAFFLLSWLLPLHIPPWVSWHSELLSFFAVFLLAGYGLFTAIKKDPSGHIGLPVAVFPLLVLALIAGIQSGAGQLVFFGDVFVFLLYLALCAICLVFGFSSTRQVVVPETSAPALSHDNPLLMGLALTLILAALVSALVAFAQVFELWAQSGWINQMPQLRRPGGNLGQPNHLATLLVMGISSLLFLYESRKMTALLSTLMAVIFFLALAATESRTGVLSFLMVLFWWFAKRRPANFSLSPWLVAFAGVGFLAWFWVWPSIFDLILQTSGGGAEINTQLGARWVVWPQLLDAAFLKPWWGWGLGQVSMAHNAVAHAYTVSEPFSYSHNILLDLVLGMGLPLTALFVFATGVWLWRRVRATKQLMPWYCLAVALPVAVHSMLEFPFAYAYFLAPVMFALGALEGLTGSKPVIRLGFQPAAALLLGVSLLAAWSAIEYVAIEEDFRVARFEDLRIGKTPAEYDRPKVILLTQLGALLDGARIVPRPNMTADELGLAKKVALRYPWPATQNRYALSLALNGDSVEALRQLRVMQALHGEKAYKAIKEYWRIQAQDHYPQLRALTLP